MVSENVIKIDSDKCTGCGLCISDCVRYNIIMENGKAKIQNTTCNRCCHCFAICPANAITMENFDLNEINPVNENDKIDADTLLNIFKSSRSIRNFKNKPIEQEKLDKILEAGRYTPTAKNVQDVTYTVISNNNNRDIEKEAVKTFKKLKKINFLISPFMQLYKVTNNFFFYGAPYTILIKSPSTVNASLAAANMALMAEAQGLGVLYSGYFKLAIKLNKKLQQLLKLNKDDKVQVCLIIGYTDLKYQRTVPRKKSSIDWIN